MLAADLKHNMDQTLPLCPHYRVSGRAQESWIIVCVCVCVELNCLSSVTADMVWLETLIHTLKASQEIMALIQRD